MPSVISYSPLDTRLLLESQGYRVVRETKMNWFLMKDGDTSPFPLPKRHITVPVANQVAHMVGMATYIAWQGTLDQGTDT